MLSATFSVIDVVFWDSVDQTSLLHLVFKMFLMKPGNSFDDFTNWHLLMSRWCTLGGNRLHSSGDTNQAANTQSYTSKSHWKGDFTPEKQCGQHISKAAVASALHDSTPSLMQNSKFKKCTLIYRIRIEVYVNLGIVCDYAVCNSLHRLCRQLMW